MAAFSGFYESHHEPPLLGGHQSGQQSEHILNRCFVCCRPGGRWGNTERVVAGWWYPVASNITLDMLHRAMPSVLHCCTTMAIEMANDGGTFVCCRRLFCLI